MISFLQLTKCTVAAAVVWSGAEAARATDNYASVVLNDHPLAYYRLADVPPPDVASNSGSLGAIGNGLYLGAGHRVAGALAADPDAAASFDGSGARVVVPFTSALNPPASQPFTVEAWVEPTIDGQGNAQAPLFNRHSPLDDSARQAGSFSNGHPPPVSISGCTTKTGPPHPLT